MTGESAVSFACNHDWLYGIVHRPARPRARGVVVVVGGPQYRAGSHRQFVLLARHLAQADVPVLRFDYRGMGDSGGAGRNFERIEDDIRAAIDCLLKEVPQIEEVVLWGLCDAASALLMYAPADPRVSGVVLVNPWIRTEQTAAQTYLRHYYLERLRDPAFWRKLASGEFRIGTALSSLLQTLRRAFVRRTATAVRQTTQEAVNAPFPERMLIGLQNFRGRVLVILSGDDITANEFKDTTARSRAWVRAFADPRVTRRDLPAANHTFSRREWRDQVSRWTAEWLRIW